MARRAKLTALLVVAALLAVPVMLVSIPTSYFESLPTLCIWKRLFGVPCPGCGMVRATSCAFRGQFRRAFAYNRLVVIVLPGLGMVWAGQLCQALKASRRARAGGAPRPLRERRRLLRPRSK